VLGLSESFTPVPGERGVYCASAPAPRESRQPPLARSA
jgi:hypothetical protein